MCGRRSRAVTLFRHIYSIESYVRSVNLFRLWWHVRSRPNESATCHPWIAHVVLSVVKCVNGLEGISSSRNSTACHPTMKPRVHWHGVNSNNQTTPSTGYTEPQRLELRVLPS